LLFISFSNIANLNISLFLCFKSLTLYCAFSPAYIHQHIITMLFNHAICVSIFLVANTLIGANCQCLPLTTQSSLCAFAPGTIASDGNDDVCNLALCCVGSNLQTVEIPNGQNIKCSDVNCPNVCKLSQDRASLGTESCNTACTPQPPPQGLGSNCVTDCTESAWAQTGKSGADALCEFLVEAGETAAAEAKCEPLAAKACLPVEESAALLEFAEPFVLFLIAVCQAAYLSKCVAATKPKDINEVRILCEGLADGTVDAACWLKCN
jgi:hypothetical protein